MFTLVGDGMLYYGDGNGDKSLRDTVDFRPSGIECVHMKDSH